jgi:restriction system protein
VAIPDYQELMIYVLRQSAQGQVRIRDAVTAIGAELKLNEADLAELLPSGSQSVFSNRVHWAKTYLAKAGLISMPRRSFFEITDRGREVLANPPEQLNTQFLHRFPEFKAFVSPRQPNASASELEVATRPQRSNDASNLAPDELIRAARDALDASLAADMLDRIVSAPPEFFERLVVQLLTRMGYGGSAEKAGRALGRSGDGGVDGVIDEDLLGLERIYVQAKRYGAGNSVGAGEIRDFFGALDQFKAGKGLFVTTSRFSEQAKRTVESLSKRIVLVDGAELTRLMILHGVGCRVQEIVKINKIDEEFFDD